MKREQTIFIFILAVVLYFIMKHPNNCDCRSCLPLGHIRTDGMPERIRMRDNGPPGPEIPYSAHIRHSDKYIGAGQHIKQHLRYDNRQGMFNGMFSGAPSHHIRYECDEPGCK